MTQKRRSHIFTSLLIIAACIFAAGDSLAQASIILGTNGQTRYSIYIDPSAPLSVKKAARELQTYFNKSAAFSPRIIESVTIPSGPFISLGLTTAAAREAINVKDIRNDGFRMVSRGDNLFIIGVDIPDGKINELGGTSNGTLNGVYTFLEDYLHIRWLMPGDLGEVVPLHKTVSIPQLDRKESSPFDYRIVPYKGLDEAAKLWASRMKLGKIANVQHHHYWAETIPPSLFDKHPEYFASVNGKRQAPSGTYKLETTNPDLVKAYAGAILKAFRSNPDMKWYSLSPADGGYGWSDSPEALALMEKDPFGNLSRTSLVLKFYNDVAGIVRKEFPERKLGGYIYSSYLYPPAAGLPKLEPNLALIVATSISYGFQLYKPSTQENWDNIIRSWGESARRDGFDVYFYDLPTTLVQYNGIITPPSPEILNFIYSRLSKYGYKGSVVYGRPVWPAYAAGNYAIARLTYNPDQDANKLLHDYYELAYGKAATPHIENLFTVLDTAYRSFYNKYPKYGYNLTPDHLKEIYVPNLQKLEQHYLQAVAVTKDRVNKKRLELFGQVLSLMQWNLKSIGLLSSKYTSALTLSDEEVDKIIFDADNNLSIASWESRTSRSVANADILQPLAGQPRAEYIVPVYGASAMLLKPFKTGEVSVKVIDFDALGEFIRYYINDESGKQLAGGAVAKGRTIKFNAEVGKTYMLEIPSRRASLELEVNGAATAYKANRHSLGFRLNAKAIKEAYLPLYFYVPSGMQGVSITLAGNDLVADVFTPSGKIAGTLDTKGAVTSRLILPDGEGFYKVMIPKHKGNVDKIITFNLDERLTQWFITDPGHPLMIREKTIHLSDPDYN